jgi:hypothetical protein
VDDLKHLPQVDSSAGETEKNFVEGLVATGQARPANPDGSLPPGATHELITGDNGQQIVKRRRFSLM